ncbi:MAG: Citrate transporter [Methanothrix sp.]|jgi:di/tricarboxylate transporter|nr:MAG: Citrate transporter [Methanothrix sp.]
MYGMTPEIELAFVVVAVAVLLLVTEVVRIDVAAVLILLLLAWTGLATPAQALSGFGSNAVISIAAIMVLGKGMERAGVVNGISRAVMRVAGSEERRLLGVTSSVVGFISAFMQNVGSAALFLPAILRISKTTRIPASRLLMPMGFSAILGGTLTMVGSSPLIVLNDLMVQSGEEPFGFFSVTPIGIVLLASGIGYFLIYGHRLLPKADSSKTDSGAQVDLIETWQLPSIVRYYFVSWKSDFVDKTREDVRMRRNYGVTLLAIVEGEEVIYSPWRRTRFSPGQVLALLGEKGDLQRLSSEHDLWEITDDLRLSDLLCEAEAGFAEVVVRPRSSIVGKTLREIGVRKNYGVEPILLLSGTEEQRKDFADRPLNPGDTFVIHGLWDRIRKIGSDRNFVLLTPVESVSLTPSKAIPATLCFLGALALALAGFQISIALLTGAFAMVLLKVIPVDEAYGAVDWRTVVLLAGLIPLGIAMEESGAARFAAMALMNLLEGSPPIVALIAVAALTTFLTLFISNVAAAVLLVPLVMVMGQGMGIDPRALALLVGLSASNSFLLPTHQVNVLLMAPGGYKSADFLKVGGIMTLIFIIVASWMVELLYL